jgi:hypothetical protein
MSAPTEKVYRTTDIGVAAALRTAGQRIKDIVIEDPSDRYTRGRAVFEFEDFDATKKLANDYYCDRLEVNARTILSNFLEYRSLIFSKENIRGG